MSDVDLFGLDEFGQPTGSLWQYGAVIGAVTQTGGAMLARNVLKSAKAFQYSEAIGAGVSALAGVGMYLMGEQTAGMATALSGAVSGVLRQFEFKSMMQKMVAIGAIAASGGQSGWGMPVVDNTVLVPGSKGLNGFGLPAIERSASLSGSMPTLVGDYGLSANPAAAGVSLQGGPSISGLGAHYGATLFSS